MCGIAGFTRFGTDFGSQEVLNRMGDTINHRGPDSHSSYIDNTVGLHHRRLAIIDLSPAGTQPMQSSCGRFKIVFNGEIYNFLEHKRILEQDGYTFRSRTDTEVILALYEKHGTACLEELNGMFAFAIWDSQRRSLFLARDRLGKKPLYYTFFGNNIAFASEIKALLSTGLVEKKVRNDALYDYMAYQYIPDPKTIFENVYKLPPAHWMEVSPDRHEKQRYWDLTFNGSIIDEDAAASLLSQRLLKATSMRMISDVPLGAFLSGGIDSSAIVATMTRFSDDPIQTCSIGFGEKEFDETRYASIAAQEFQTDHHEFFVDKEFPTLVADIARFFDEPFADASLVPTFFVSKLARQKVTVALAGDGGDELFAGYEKYVIDRTESRWRSRTPNFFRKRFCSPLANALENSRSRLLRKASTLLRSISLEPAEAFYRTNSQISDLQWSALARDELKSQLGSYHPKDITIEYYNKCSSEEHLSKVLYTDIHTYLPGDILVKVDRMSMANSLEVRAPLLDFKLAELAASLSNDLKLRNGEKKYILKTLFRSLLPDEIIERKKMGFSPPTASWLRSELKDTAEAALFSDSGGLMCFFVKEEILRLWHEHQSENRDHSSVLWSLFMFALWHHNYCS